MVSRAKTLGYIYWVGTIVSGGYNYFFPAMLPLSSKGYPDSLVCLFSHCQHRCVHLVAAGLPTRTATVPPSELPRAAIVLS